MNEYPQLNQYPEIERLSQLEGEKNRIENLLGEHVPAKEAAEVCDQLFDWALELDEVAREIQEDQTVKNELDYDGVMFSYKEPGRNGFFVSYDGLHLLRALNRDNIGVFFGGSPQNNGKTEMLEWIKQTRVDVPKVRLENLREGGSIGLVSPEAIREIVESMKREEVARQAETPSPLPKDRFWEFYEEELRTWSERPEGGGAQQK